MAMTIDPSEHTVEEVQAHLAEHPEEVEAILEAEKKGKGRKSLTERPFTGVVFDRKSPDSGELEVVTNE